MNKAAYQYVIVRFAPYVETGEFANVGIVMIAPQQRFFGFKLETKRTRRIGDFFPELDRNLFKHSISNLNAELERLDADFKLHGFDQRKRWVDTDYATRIFDELIRPREVILRFCEPRVVLADNPQQKLDELFDFYVHRNFVTKEYKETVLEKSLRHWFNQENIGGRFRQQVLGNDLYQAKFPFVEMRGSQVVKVIKPLDLAKDKPNKIIDHGTAWLVKVRQLKKLNALPRDVLFAVEGPTPMNGESNAFLKRQNAYDEIVNELGDAGMQVADHHNREQIIDFASAY